MLECEYVARFMQGYGVGSVPAVCRKSENAKSWNIVIRKQGLKSFALVINWFSPLLIGGTSLE